MQVTLSVEYKAHISSLSMGPLVKPSHDLLVIKLSAMTQIHVSKMAKFKDTVNKVQELMTAELIFSKIKEDLYVLNTSWRAALILL